MSPRAVVVGCSFGGVRALKTVLGGLPAEFPLPILVVQHLAPDGDGGLAGYLNERSALRVSEAEEKEFAEPGRVYLITTVTHGRQPLFADLIV